MPVQGIVTLGVLPCKRREFLNFTEMRKPSFFFLFVCLKPLNCQMIANDAVQDVSTEINLTVMAVMAASSRGAGKPLELPMSGCTNQSRMD